MLSNLQRFVEPLQINSHGTYVPKKTILFHLLMHANVTSNTCCRTRRTQMLPNSRFLVPLQLVVKYNIQLFFSFFFGRGLFFTQVSTCLADMKLCELNLL